MPGKTRVCTNVSIHAPVRVRHDVGYDGSRAVLFQSTHPCGGDRPGERRVPVQCGSTPPTGAGATELSWANGAI